MNKQLIVGLFLLASMLVQAQTCTDNATVISGKCTCNAGFYGTSADAGQQCYKCPSNSNSSTDSNTGISVNVSACNTCLPGYFLGGKAKTDAPQQAATCSTCGTGATTSTVGQVLQTVVNCNACLPGYYMQTLQTGNNPAICAQCPPNSTSTQTTSIGFCQCYDSLAAPLSAQVSTCKCKDGYSGNVATQQGGASGCKISSNSLILTVSAVLLAFLAILI
ncbi:hypothetical protein ABPG74_018505 [Tetrahymena malaccensis]